MLTTHFKQLLEKSWHNKNAFFKKKSIAIENLNKKGYNEFLTLLIFYCDDDIRVGKRIL